MDILIRGGGFENKGAEAMIRTVQAHVGRRIEGVRFGIEVPPREIRAAEAAGLRAVPLPGGSAVGRALALAGAMARRHEGASPTAATSRRP